MQVRQNRDKVVGVVEEASFRGCDGAVLFQPGAVAFDVPFRGSGEREQDFVVCEEGIVLAGQLLELTPR